MKLSCEFFVSNPEARLPHKSTDDEAGYDMFACLDGKMPVTVPAKGKAIISTGVHLALPEGYYGNLRPRSGLAAKNSLHVGAGTCDRSYRGEYKVILFNLGDDDYTVNHGDRIAQLIVTPYVSVNFKRVDRLEDLGKTERGDKGFGSSGR